MVGRMMEISAGLHRHFPSTIYTDVPSGIVTESSWMVGAMKQLLPIFEFVIDAFAPITFPSPMEL
jgi:hypothetical protein